MNTFDVLSGGDVKEQLEKLHESVTQYINHIKDTIENKNDGNSNNVDVDKILQNLGEIKANLIETLLSKKTSNYVLHALNVVYNFDAFLNPIATTVVTYGIQQLYVNKIGLEIISDINNIIKCVCMDMIARSKANRGLAEVSNMSKDYGMKISEVMSITQKYIDSRDAQVMQMMDQTIQHDIDGFKENIESADKLIEAFSQNDKWVAEWGMTTKAITLQSANNLCLKIRKDMGSYITALSTCLDRHVVDNLKFDKDDYYYDERHIDNMMAKNNQKLKNGYAKADEAEREKENLIKKGKELHNEIKIRKYKDFQDLDDDKKEALQAYWNSDNNKAPQAVRFIYDKDRLMLNMKRVLESINVSKENKHNEEDAIISKDFYLVMGDDDFRLYVYDLMDYSFSSHTEDIIKNNYQYYHNDKRSAGNKPDKSAKLEILRFKNLLIRYYNILKQKKKYGED